MFVEVVRCLLIGLLHLDLHFHPAKMSTSQLISLLPKLTPGTKFCVWNKHQFTWKYKLTEYKLGNPSFLINAGV